jgi:hypothetical protein
LSSSLRKLERLLTRFHCVPMIDILVEAGHLPSVH